MKSPVLVAGLVCCISCTLWAAPDSPQALPQPNAAGRPAAAPSAPSAMEAARQVLPSLTLENTTLAKALSTIAGRTGARILVDWSGLARMNVTPDSRVTVQGEKLSVARALDMMLAAVKDAKAPLGWTIYSNTFVITSQAQILHLRRFSEAVRTQGRPPGSSMAVQATATSRPAQPPAAMSGTRRMDFQFVQMPLEDVIAYLRTSTGLNIVPNWRAMEQVGVQKTSPVNLTVTNVTLGQGLDLIFEPFNASKTPLERVYWEMREGVLSITTGAVLDAQVETRVYDVSDLLLVVPDFAPSSTLTTGSSAGSTGSSGGTNTGTAGRGGSYSGNSPSGAVNLGQPGASGQTGAATADIGAPEERLIAVVQSMIGPDYWQPAGKGSIRIFRGQMIISQSRLGFILLDRGF